MTKIDCPECDGEGYIVICHHGDPWCWCRGETLSCEICDGEGMIDEDEPCWECGEPLRPTDRSTVCDDCEADFAVSFEDTRPDERYRQARGRCNTARQLAAFEAWHYRRSPTAERFERLRNHYRETARMWHWVLAWNEKLTLEKDNDR